MKHLLILSIFIGSVSGAAEFDFEAYFRQNAKSPALNRSAKIQEAFSAPKVYKCLDDPKVGPLSGRPFRSSQRYAPMVSGSRFPPKRGF